MIRFQAQYIGDRLAQHEAANAHMEDAQSPPIPERRCVLYERNFSIADRYNKTMSRSGAQVTIGSTSHSSACSALHMLLNCWRYRVSTVALACRHR